MDNIKVIDSSFIENSTDVVQLVRLLKNAFKTSEVIVPMRHHHDFPNPEEGIDSTLLLMPAWNPGAEAGVKIVSVSPQNGKYDLPSIQGTYIYLDAHKGNVKAILDAKALTAKRTASTSALASTYLSKENAVSLLMIGTGTLAKELILAHTSVRPIKIVFVYGRDFQKAKRICDEFEKASFTIKAVTTIEEVISNVDIISCATLSAFPLVLGKYLKAGQHVDLVGAYKKDMREADDEVILKSTVFIDTYQGGMKESGDIAIPLQSGVLKAEDVKADLFQLCKNERNGRTSLEEITMFKSVGHALEDLTAANYYYKLYCEKHKEDKLLLSQLFVE